MCAQVKILSSMLQFDPVNRLVGTVVDMISYHKNALESHHYTPDLTLFDAVIPLYYCGICAGHNTSVDHNNSKHEPAKSSTLACLTSCVPCRVKMSVLLHHPYFKEVVYPKRMASFAFCCLSCSDPVIPYTHAQCGMIGLSRGCSMGPKD